MKSNIMIQSEVDYMTSDEYRKISMLLSAIKNGSRDAFAEIFEMYEKKVYFVCCKLLKSKSEAKTMTIEIFALAYIQISNLPNAATFEKWLYTTVFSQCRRYIIDNRPDVFGDYIDSNSPEGEKIDILLTQDYDDMLNYPNGIDVSMDIMQTADSILSEMPQKLRNVAILHYLCGFDGEEIARIEQISFAAYKNRLYKARIRLKTEEHKYSGIGYAVEGMVTFFADVLSTMAESIVVPRDIASSVTARTGINCIKKMRASDDYSDEDTIPLAAIETKQRTNYQPTAYAIVTQQKKSFGQDMSPAVKVLMAIIAILVIIGGTVAVMLAIQNRNESNDIGSIDSFDNTTETTTLEITTQETTTEAESTTEEETTTEETTTDAETTTQAETTVAETTEVTTQTTTETTTAENTTAFDDENAVYIEPLE